MARGIKQAQERIDRMNELASRLKEVKWNEWDRVKAKFCLEYGLSERTVNEYTRILALSGALKKDK
jgi:hypothetical protein